MDLMKAKAQKEAIPMMEAISQRLMENCSTM